MDYSLLQLAYIGDSIYEVYVRKYLLSLNIVKVNDLQSESLKYVSAKSQNEILTHLINKNILSENELDIIRRGRNVKVHSKPKNCDILTYKYATAFESLFGYLYFRDEKRIKEIFKEIICFRSN